MSVEAASVTTTSASSANSKLPAGGPISASYGRRQVAAVCVRAGHLCTARHRFGDAEVSLQKRHRCGFPGCLIGITHQRSRLRRKASDQRSHWLESLAQFGIRTAISRSGSNLAGVVSAARSCDRDYLRVRQALRNRLDRQSGCTPSLTRSTAFRQSRHLSCVIGSISASNRGNH